MVGFKLGFVSSQAETAFTKGSETSGESGVFLEGRKSSLNPAHEDWICLSVLYTVPGLALLSHRLPSLISVVCYLSGGPLDDLFQLWFQALHYSLDGLGDFFQFGKSLR